MFGLGGVVYGLLLLYILAALGLVFISGSIIALFLKIIGMSSGRAVLWGFGVPLVGCAVMGLLIALQVQATQEEPQPILIDYPPGGLQDDGE
jgi:hypothetical protein